ncbi:3-ketoacyl-CoA thiolase [Alcanivorax sp. ALC70]|nr:3-ketoacyl-CoA thiolase [Alcanivorax sp. ALC70]
MLAGDNVRKVAIVGGNRIPFARSNTAYFEVGNQDMLTAALNGLVDRFKLHGERMGEVAAGAVMKHAKDFNLVRESVLGSKLAPETPAYDLQQACGTGLEAAILVANKIALGQIDSAVAGGVDTTSDAPLGVNEQARKIFMEINRAKSTGDKLKQAVKLINPKLMIPDIPRMASRAPACPWASTRRSPPPSGASPGRPRTSWPGAPIRTWPSPTRKAGSRT